MRVENRYFGKSRVRITIRGEPHGTTVAYCATASIDGEPVLGSDGTELELTASTEEEPFDRMSKGLSTKLGESA